MASGECKNNAKSKFKIIIIKLFKIIIKWLVLLGLSLGVFALLNYLWFVFEKRRTWFPSPLNYSETLTAVIDVILSVIIASATISIERRWRKESENFEEKERQLREKMKTQQLISERLVELSAIPYANSTLHMSISEFPRFLDVSQYLFDETAFTLVVLNNNSPLFPPYLNISARSKTVKAAVLDADKIVDFNTASNLLTNELTPSFDSNILRLFPTLNSGKYDYSWLRPFLINALFLKCKKDRNLSKKLVVLLPINVVDEHTTVTNMKKNNLSGRSEDASRFLSFDVDLLLEFEPSTSFDDRYCFRCRSSCREKVCGNKK